MKTPNKNLEKILSQPSYWLEGINGLVYNALLDYMENYNLNRTKLAEHLGISKGRVSQILNDGEINFSVEKLIEIALKVDKFPIVEFKNKEEVLQKEVIKQNCKKLILDYNKDYFSTVEEVLQNKKTKIIPLYSKNNTAIAINYNG